MNTVCGMPMSKISRCISSATAIAIAASMAFALAITGDVSAAVATWPSNSDESAALGQDETQSVELRLHSGNTRSGSLLAVSGDKWRISSSEGVEEISFDEIESVGFVDRPAQSTQQGDEAAEIRLSDGSLLRAQTLSIENRRMSIEWSESATVEFELRHTASALFQRLDGPLLQQWLTISDKTFEASDALVVRRGDSLDWIEGIVNELNETTIRFQVDERQLDVPRQRVAGIVFHRPAKVKTLDLHGHVVLTGGSKLAVHQIEGDHQMAEVILAANVTIRLPWSAIERFQSGANVRQSLADLSAVSTEYHARVVHNELKGLVQAWDRPRSNQSFTGGPLALALPREPLPLEELLVLGSDDAPQRTEYSTGIAIKSGWSISYSLDGQYETLTGAVGLDPDQNYIGVARVEFFGDGKLLAQIDLDDASASAAELDVPLQDVRRLLIRVTGEPAVDTAIVHLCEMLLSAK